MIKGVTRAAVATTAAALALTAAVVTAPTANAASATKLTTRATGVSPDANTKSKYLAGYEAGVAIKKVTATFKVPRVTCTSDLAAIALGIGNEQTAGQPTVLADVFVACQDGNPLYILDAFAGGKDKQGTAAVGDVIEVTITQTASKETAIAKNVTQNTSVRASGTPTPDQAVLFGSFPLYVQGSNQPVAVPKFAPATLSENTVNGKALKTTNPTAYDRYLKTTLVIKTSPITAAGSFKLTYQTAS